MLELALLLEVPEAVELVAVAAQPCVAVHMSVGSATELLGLVWAAVERDIGVAVVVVLLGRVTVVAAAALTWTVAMGVLAVELPC